MFLACVLALIIMRDKHKLTVHSKEINDISSCPVPEHWKPQKGKVLVIINGQLRGGPVAWSSMEKKLLDFYGADLALIGPPISIKEQVAASLRQRAKYIWTVPEYEDWGVILDTIYDDASWRALCKFNESTKTSAPHLQFLGGVKKCHPGSAGILLAYRYLTMTKILDHGLADIYEWFIYTRSDYTYLCSPPPIHQFSTAYLHIPNSEGYGGVTDRHTYIPGHLILKVLNVTNDVVKNWKYWEVFRVMNLEILLKVYFVKYQICFQKFDHTAFTVRRKDDPTRWSVGVQHDSLSAFNLTLKYHEEIIEANNSCNPWKKFQETL